MQKTLIIAPETTFNIDITLYYVQILTFIKFIALFFGNKKPEGMTSPSGSFLFSFGLEISADFRDVLELVESVLFFD